MFQINFSELSQAEIAETATKKLSEPIKDWEKQIWLFLQQWLSTDETISVFTSGSTGLPKQVYHHKQHVKNNAQATCAALKLTKGNTALLCLPANKISGIMMLVRSIELPMNLICMEPSVYSLLHIPANKEIDFAAFTPMQFQQIMESVQAEKNASQIRNVILGGEGISQPLLQYITKLSTEVYITFGMTETISHIALKKLTGKNADAQYNTLPDITVSSNTENQLIIQAPKFGQPHLLTNDEVKIVSPTQFEWMGRTDNVINSGGVKIHAEEVERKLQEHINIPFFVTRLAHDKTGEQVAIAIEAKTLLPGLLAKLKSIFQFLPKLEQPKTLILVEFFSRTDNGKINRGNSLKNMIDKISL